MDLFAKLIGNISGFMYDRLLIIMLLAVGLFFTIVTKCPQFRLLAESIRVVGEKPGTKGGISSFQALMVSTASRVGTGNIVGVSVAICSGGYGAVFWMWVIAVIGGASAFVESTLAQIYKKRDAEGGSYGGPAYYIEALTKGRFLSIVFAVSMILTYAVGFNMLASFNLQSTFSAYSFYDPSVTPWVIGALLAVLVGYCLLGGGKRIVKTTSVLVPFMGVVYILVSLYVIVTHLSLFPVVMGKIFESAFDFKAIFGGIAGSALMHGIKRGLYSNEAGIGSAPNAAAAAIVSHPVKQGLVQMLSVFIDTLLLCTATAFMCLFSGVAPAVELKGAPWVQSALSTVMGSAGPIFITVAMVLFAFTTLLGNLYYVDNLWVYIFKKAPSKTFMLVYRIAAMAVVCFGAAMEIGLVWDIADVLMGIMAIINLPVIVLLAKPAIAALNDYTRQRREGKNPVYVAADNGVKQKTDFWN